MNKKCLVALLVLTSVISCSKKENSIDLSQSAQCISEQSHCYLESPFGVIDIAFDSQYLVAEQPFKLHIKSKNSNLAVLGGYMEGVDMYMGKIPLLFNQAEQGDFIAKTMFGSCSMKQMQWRVWLTLADTQSADESVKKISFTVTSYQSISAIPAENFSTN